MSLQSEYYESLAHHGVKGMKWGRRRFQNEDGSLTPAGKRRYSMMPDGDGFAYKSKTPGNADGYSKQKMPGMVRSAIRSEQKTPAGAIIDGYAKSKRPFGAKVDGQFKKDVKVARKRGLDADYEYDPETGELQVTQWYDSKNRKIGADYAMKVLSAARGSDSVSSLATGKEVKRGKSALDEFLK